MHKFSGVAIDAALGAVRLLFIILPLFYHVLLILVMNVFRVCLQTKDMFVRSGGNAKLFPRSRCALYTKMQDIPPF